MSSSSVPAISDPCVIPAPEHAGPYVRRLEIDVSKPQAEACLVFTRALDASGKTHYEDYLSIDPALRVVIIRGAGKAFSIGGHRDMLISLGSGKLDDFQSDEYRRRVADYLPNHYG